MRGLAPNWILPICSVPVLALAAWYHLQTWSWIAADYELAGSVVFYGSVMMVLPCLALALIGLGMRQRSFAITSMAAVMSATLLAIADSTWNGGSTENLPPFAETSCVLLAIMELGLVGLVLGPMFLWNWLAGDWRR